MDFVVVGFGVGALGILVGLVARDAGSWWWRRGAAATAASGAARRRLAAGRAGGRVLALGGVMACLATLLALLFRLSDRSGALLVLAAIVLATAAAIVWAGAYAHRYHPRPTETGSRRTAAVANGHSLADTHLLDSVASADPALLPSSARPSEPDRATAGLPPLGAVMVDPEGAGAHVDAHGDRSVSGLSDSDLPDAGHPWTAMPAVEPGSHEQAVTTPESTGQGIVVAEPSLKERDRDGETGTSPSSAVTQRLTTVGTPS